MALHGKLIQLDGGRYGFECSSIHHAEPIKITHIWRVSRFRVRGMYWADEKSAIGKEATLTDNGVSVYLGNGAYFEGWVDDEDRNAISVTEARIPCPKVKAGIETRWNTLRSQWEKLLRKGWVSA